MPTRIGTAARALFVSIAYVVLYEAMQLAAAVTAGLVGASGALAADPKTAFSGSVIENLFLCTFAAMLAAGVLYIAISLLRERSVFEDVRFSSISSREVICAVALAVGCRIAVSVYTVASEKIEPLRESLENIPDTTAAFSSPFKIFLGIFVAMLAAPAFEEILFRGFIQSELMRGFPAPAAIIISSIIFAAAHGVLFQSVFTFFVGLAMGYCYYKTGSLFTSIILHVAFNSSSAVQFLFFIVPVPLLIVLFVLSLVIIGASVKALKCKA